MPIISTTTLHTSGGNSFRSRPMICDSASPKTPDRAVMPNTSPIPPDFAASSNGDR